MTSKRYDPVILDRVQKVNLKIYQDFADLCERHDINYFAISGTAIGTLRHKGFIPWDDDIDIAMLRDDYERFVGYAQDELSEKYYLMGPEFEHKYYNLTPNLVLKNTTFVTDSAWAGDYAPGFFLDIFIFDNIPEDAPEAKRYRFWCKLYATLWRSGHIKSWKLMRASNGLAENIKLIIGSVLHGVLYVFPGSESWVWRQYSKLVDKYRGKTKRYSALTDAGMLYMYVDEDEIYPLVDLPFEGVSMKMVHEYKRQLARHMGADYMVIPPVSQRTNHCPRYINFGNFFNK